MSETLFGEAKCYRITAWYPDSRAAPHVEYARTKWEGIDQVIALAKLGKHTTIELATPSALMIVRMWGQLADLP